MSPLDRLRRLLQPTLSKAPTLLAFAQQAKQLALDFARGVRRKKPHLPRDVARKRVILVGASVGMEWRLHLAFPRIRTIPVYAFDKTAAIRAAIARRPDAIIIKECAAYFPSTEVDHTHVIRWVEEILAAGILPILATVVPVTHAHEAKAPGRLAALLSFNDWVRAYANEHRIPVLDLEAAVRISAQDRSLDERWHSGDGLHLEPRTYRERLDPLVPPVLVAAFAPTKSRS